MSNSNRRVRRPLSQYPNADTNILSTTTTNDHHEHSGRQLAPVFMRLPSKRQYPDYYDVIKQPIALEDIKVRLDGNKYTSLDDVRQDFELCFKNARRYNVRESQIWRDAKSLQVRIHSLDH